MSQSEGAASTSSTSPPTSGAVTPTATPAGGATSSTAPSTAPARLSGWKTAATAAASLGAALGLKSDEQRAREAEHNQLMEESARTLEELKRQRAQAGPGGSAQRFELPGQRAERPIRDPGGSAAPRVDSQDHDPLSAPGASNGRAIAEPDGELQAPLSLHNPYGQHGKPDHQAMVKRLKKLAEREFPNAEIQTGTSIYQYTHVNRRPDVWVFDPKALKVLKVYEATRVNPDGSLPKRERLKKDEYDQAGIPNHFEPVTP